MGNLVKETTFETQVLDEVITRNGFQFEISKNSIINEDLVNLQVPILIEHEYHIKNIVGKTTGFFLNEEEKKLYSVFQIHNKVIQDKINNGLVDSVSVGVLVKEFKKNVIKKFEILELSLVAIPASRKAKIKTNESLKFNFSFKILNKKDLNMEKVNKETAGMEFRETTPGGLSINLAEKTKETKEIKEELEKINLKIEALSPQKVFHYQNLNLNQNKTFLNKEDIKNLNSSIDGRTPFRKEGHFFLKNGVTEIVGPERENRIVLNIKENENLNNLEKLINFKQVNTTGSIVLNKNEWKGKLAKITTGEKQDPQNLNELEKLEIMIDKMGANTQFSVESFKNYMSNPNEFESYIKKFNEKLFYDFFEEKFIESLKAIPLATTSTQKDKIQVFSGKGDVPTLEDILDIRHKITRESSSENVFLVSNDIFLEIEKMPGFSGASFPLLNKERRVKGEELVIRLDKLQEKTLFFGDFKSIFNGILNEKLDIVFDFTQQNFTNSIFLFFHMSAGYGNFLKNIYDSIVKWKKA